MIVPETAFEGFRFRQSKGQRNETRLVDCGLLRAVHFAIAGAGAKGCNNHTVVVHNGYIERAAHCLAPEGCPDRCIDLRRDAGRDIAGAQASLSPLRICPLGEPACDQQGNRP